MMDQIDRNGDKLVSTKHWGLTVLLAGGLVLSSCGTPPVPDATNLTIVTTENSVDIATSLAVAEYVQLQGISVELSQQNSATEVFDALETETSAQHAVIGVVQAEQEHNGEEQQLQIPDAVDVVAQAPVELTYTAVASPATSATFSRSQALVEDAESELEATCGDLTWFHMPWSEKQHDDITGHLADQDCAPTLETLAPGSEAYEQLLDTLMKEPDTVALVHGIEPAIVDQGLGILDIDTTGWPQSSVVAVANQPLDEPLRAHISVVLETLDDASATDLLRSYHGAQVSRSDLSYEVGEAIRYWLAGRSLVDPDTVINVTTAGD